MNQTFALRVHMFRPNPLAGWISGEAGAYRILDGVVFSAYVVDDARDAQGSSKAQ